MAEFRIELTEEARGDLRLLSEADDFEREVETLRNSLDFQRFLDERSRSTGRISLDDFEAESSRK